jgi:hypothetical protein
MALLMPFSARMTENSEEMFSCLESNGSLLLPLRTPLDSAVSKMKSTHSLISPFGFRSSKVVFFGLGASVCVFHLACTC